LPKVIACQVFRYEEQIQFEKTVYVDYEKATELKAMAHKHSSSNTPEEDAGENEQLGIMDVVEGSIYAHKYKPFWDYACNVKLAEGELHVVGYSTIVY
jgi:hypothetical protein